ncbi:MAG: alpha/beta hydrolase [Chloroflexi bacterium]|nr:alpha/beta hydrolase [Chloroflexota bacterium]
MNNPRAYGTLPFNVALVHGGPGAAGEMAPVAHELASRFGVLEPFQTASWLEGQVEELRTILENNANLPVTLTGFSWGAWLSFILAARYPAMVKKLILIGSGPFEERYAAGIQSTRLSRLSTREKREVESLSRILDDPSAKDKDTAFARLGALLSKADACDPMAGEAEGIDCRFDIFESVWKDASEMRRSGKLLELAKRIECPVTAIHGDYDPHPAKGVQKPLATALKSFRFVLLKRCGHRPWIERQTRDEFYRILEGELG